MRYRPWLLSPGLALGLLVFLVAPGLAEDESQSKVPRADPPGTAPIMAQLRTLFAAWDRNLDDSLSKEELAKGFRGPSARPYDHKAQDLHHDAEKSKPRTRYGSYPDYQFLIAFDQDSDEKLSRKEFESWARDYAVEVRKVLNAQKRLAEAERRLARELSEAARAELRRERQALARLRNQMRHQFEAIEKHLQKARP
jgi:hypothetical protein